MNGTTPSDPLAATIRQARALRAAVDRPNLYIKIPATREGLAAITTVIGEGDTQSLRNVTSQEQRP